MSNQVPPPRHETIDLADEHAAFLSGPPRSGELTPAAQLIAAQCFIWLASIVVFGSTADWASQRGNECSPLCGFAIAAGVISFFFTSFILAGQYLTWSLVEKPSWCTSKATKTFMFILLFWWIIIVATLSAYDDQIIHTTGLAIIFGWLAFFAAVFASYKAYHAEQEETKSLRYAQILSMQATEEDEYANFS